MLALRQLRHHTKNALQRILAQLENSPLRATAAGMALADDVQRRIMLSARISDALFGFMSMPDLLERRLERLADATLDLLSDGTQTVECRVQVVGCCPDPLTPVVLQATYEMLGNAIKHGMHLRLVGHVIVVLQAAATGSLDLSVSDDGWGPVAAQPGEGCSIMVDLAAQHGGSFRLERRVGWTVATMSIPRRPH